MILVEAHFLQRTELKFDSFSSKRRTKLFSGDAVFEAVQVTHLVYQIVSEVLAEFRPLNPHIMLVEQLIALGLISRGKDRLYTLPVPLILTLTAHCLFLATCCDRTCRGLVIASPFEHLVAATHPGECVHSQTACAIELKRARFMHQSLFCIG